MRADIAAAASALPTRLKPMVKLPGPMKKCVKALEAATSGGVEQIAVVFDPPLSFREMSALGAVEGWKEIQPYLLGQTATELIVIRSGSFGKPTVETISRSTVTGISFDSRRTVGQLGLKANLLFLETTAGTAVWKFGAQGDRDQFVAGFGI